MSSQFASVEEAAAVITAIRDHGKHPTLELADDHWLWRHPLQNGQGPFLSFCVATFGQAPAGTVWHCTCGAQARGCVRPAHYTLIRDGEEPPVHPAIRTEFTRRIGQESASRRDRRAFARELGISQSTLAAWIAGEQHPGAEVEERLAKRFGWDGIARRWIVTVVFQTVLLADAAGAAAEQAIRPLQTEGFPTKAVIHSVTRVA